MAKTRDRLIEVARLLFARTGVENTTMNDIANASNKGRRTLYTYFKSKTDIYQAVVESELNILYQSLEAVVKQEIPADRKLIEFIGIRAASIRNIVLRNGTLKARFFRDQWQVENVRRDFDLQEIRYIQMILDDGIQSGMFVIDDTLTMATILHHALKGLELPYIRGTMKGFSPSNHQNIESITNLLFNGIKKK